MSVNLISPFVAGHCHSSQANLLTPRTPVFYNYNFVVVKLLIFLRHALRVSGPIFSFVCTLLRICDLNL